MALSLVLPFKCFCRLIFHPKSLLLYGIFLQHGSVLSCLLEKLLEITLESNHTLINAPMFKLNASRKNLSFWMMVANGLPNYEVLNKESTNILGKGKHAHPI
jgi:hypothetical protein